MAPSDDDLARLRAQMDQTKEGAKEFAASLAAFHQELMAQGFSEDQALALTMTYITALLQNVGGD